MSEELKITLPVKGRGVTVRRQGTYRGYRWKATARVPSHPLYDLSNAIKVTVTISHPERGPQHLFACQRKVRRTGPWQERLWREAEGVIKEELLQFVRMMGDA